MAINIDNDVTSVSIRLNELKNKFDQGIRNGETFANVRKELECSLKAMRWNPWTSSATKMVT